MDFKRFTLRFFFKIYIEDYFFKKSKISFKLTILIIKKTLFKQI
jgi:hypothetical protein